MLIPKVNRNETYKALFPEGVIWAKKDYNLPKHPEVGQGGEAPIDVPNLHVIKLMQSFRSKGFVKEIYSWRHYYWYLTDEGIEYLREYLNLSADVVPNTLKKSARAPTRVEGERPGGDRGDRGGRGGRGGFGGDRAGYRSERPGFGGRGGQ
jgi:small subunit ribosomal protein S10e